MIDLQRVFRRLTRSHAFAVAATMLIAIPLGTSIAVFGIVHAVLLRPLPYRNAGRVVFITERAAGASATYVGPAELRALKGGAAGFQDVAAIINVRGDVRGQSGLVQLDGYMVTPNLFGLLGVSAAHGRTFNERDNTDAGPSIVLSDDAWRTEFGSDTSLIGKPIIVDGTPHVLLGVMPPGVRFPDSPTFHRVARPAFWMPMPSDAEPVGIAFGLMRPGIDLRRLSLYGAAVASHLSPDPRMFPNDVIGAKVSFTFTPSGDQVVRDVRHGLWLLLAGSGILCLVMVVDVGGLWTTRIAARDRETAVRIALGGGRRSVVIPWLVDSAIIGIAGAVLATVLAAAELRVFVALVPLDVPRIAESGIGLPEVGIALAVGIGGCCLAALVPALRAAGRPMYSSLAMRPFGPKTRAHRSALRGVSVVEVALCTALAVAGGLLVRSVLHIEREPLGFDTNRIVNADVSANASTAGDLNNVDTLYDALAANLAALPGISSVAYAFPAPLSNLASLGAVSSLEFADRPASLAESSPATEVTLVSPGYFRTMGIPLRAGRDFAAHDDGSAPDVAMIDERTARRFWPGESPIGHRVRTNYLRDTTSATIIGVVGTIRSANLVGEPAPQLYLPLRRYGSSLQTAILRTTVPPTTLVSQIRQVIRSDAPDVAIGAISPMHDIVLATLAQRRIAALLILVLAVEATLLAVSGVYGAVAQSAAERAPEMGIRMALGADRHTVFRLMVGEGTAMAGLGIVAGLLLFMAFARVLQNQLVATRVLDPIIVATVSIIILLTAFLASYLPARRLSRVDPMVVLRAE